MTPKNGIGIGSHGNFWETSWWLAKASIPNFSALDSPEVAVSLLSRVLGVGVGAVSTRFKANWTEL